MKIDYANTCILLVDDEPDSIEVVEMLLTSKGAEVITANNGKHGFELFNAHNPAIVLTDLSMPEMSGWDLLASIRGIETKRTPVIAITAHAMENDKQKILAADFDGYITKPVSLFNLLDDIEGWL